jgi:hypothetical protein
MIKKENIKEAIKGDKSFLYYLLKPARLTKEEDIEQKYRFENGYHPDDVMLYDYALKWTDRSNIKKVTYHVANCPGCMAELLEIMKLEQDVDEEYVYDCPQSNR